ncbi:hypothetical protein ADUPG1_010695 [Aduncisulcus paluster]|uniref:Mitochondrial import inner membrane translocase subunit TIM50 n=1 Tax=Aduncisulcus paluster TaxID=2918883 RepID=A0ABQ5JWY1_9EUKA|nr:hypothetical protein ADUPG1_010695 [Aduncisulcus paluster]
MVFARRVYRALCSRDKVGFSEQSIAYSDTPRDPTAEICDKLLFPPMSLVEPCVYPHFESSNHLLTHMDFILPPRNPRYSFTAVFDMDHTLLYASYKPLHDCDGTMVTQDCNGKTRFYVKIRPYAKELLHEIKRRGGEVVIFTASVKDYADRCLAILDPHNRYIDHRLYRDNCISISQRDMDKTIESYYYDSLREKRKAYLEKKRQEEKKKALLEQYYAFFGLDEYSDDEYSEAKSEGEEEKLCDKKKEKKEDGEEEDFSIFEGKPILPFDEIGFSKCLVKDLSRLGRDMRTVFIVDDNPASYALQPLAAIACRRFRGEDDDDELLLIGNALFHAIKDGHTENVSGMMEAIKAAQDHIEIFRIPEKEHSRESRAVETTANVAPSGTSEGAEDAITSEMHQEQDSIGDEEERDNKDPQQLIISKPTGLLDQEQVIQATPTRETSLPSVDIEGEVSYPGLVDFDSVVSHTNADDASMIVDDDSITSGASFEHVPTTTTIPSPKSVEQVDMPMMQVSGLSCDIDCDLSSIAPELSFSSPITIGEDDTTLSQGSMKEESNHSLPTSTSMVVPTATKQVDLGDIALYLEI